MACKPGREVGTATGTDGLPHKINGTMISGVNPFYPRSALEKCCKGPITNITSPAPEEGPLSASWPAVCIAYCAVKIKLDYNDSDSVASQEFYDCWTAAVKAKGYEEWQVIGTGTDRFGPGECVPFAESPGCTNDAGAVWQTTGGYSSLPLPTVTTSMTSNTEQTVTQTGTNTAVMTTSTSDSNAQESKGSKDSKDSKDSASSRVTLSRVALTVCLLSLLL